MHEIRAAQLAIIARNSGVQTWVRLIVILSV
jgi:hypothetical protein